MNPLSWEAPRVAYLLTAAAADYAAQCDVVAAGDAVSAQWTCYDAGTQRDILAALGAQTRLAVKMLHDKLGVEIEMDWHRTARVACAEALLAAHELIKPRPGPWAAPECAHCRQVIAKTLCGLQIQAYSRLGFTPAMIAAMCRQSADAVETSPRH